MIQVSDRVKQAEQQRLGRAQIAHQAFPHHMAGGALRVGVPPAPQVAAPAPAPAAARPQYVPAPPLAAFDPHNQHMFLHQPQMLQHAQFNFALPARQANLVPPPFQQLPAYPGQRGAVPLQPLQAPNPQQQFVDHHFFAQRNLDFLQQNPPDQYQ
jgi:hypothetical protein